MPLTHQTVFFQQFGKKWVKYVHFFLRILHNERLFASYYPILGFLSFSLMTTVLYIFFFPFPLVSKKWIVNFKVKKLHLDLKGHIWQHYWDARLTYSSNIRIYDVSHCFKRLNKVDLWDNWETNIKLVHVDINMDVQKKIPHLKKHTYQFRVFKLLYFINRVEYFLRWRLSLKINSIY